MPRVADPRAVHVAARQQPVEGADRVVDHHSPEHLALPEHRLEGVELRGVAALAEAPVVDAQGDVALVGERLRVRHGLQVRPARDELLLPDVVAAAVRVVEDDGRRRAARAPRPGQVRGHGLEAVEVEDPRLEHVAVLLLLSALRRGDRPTPVREVAQHLVEPRPASRRVAVRTAGRRGDRQLGAGRPRPGREGRPQTRPRRLQEIPPHELAHGRPPGCRLSRGAGPATRPSSAPGRPRGGPACPACPPREPRPRAAAASAGPAASSGEWRTRCRPPGTPSRS